jgi:hypothetical protein
MNRLVNALALITIGAIGCSTQVGLSYRGENAVPARPGDSVLSLGEVKDQRQKGPRELGVVRGGYGNVLKRLVTSDTIESLVRQAFRAALEQRGLLAQAGRERVQLRIVIKKLDCNYLMSREAHAEIDVTGIEAGSERTVWSESYRSDVVEGAMGAGVFADVEHLRGMAEIALNRVIDDAVKDARLQLAVLPPAAGKATLGGERTLGVVPGQCEGRDGSPPEIGEDWERYRSCQAINYRLIGREKAGSSAADLFAGDGGEGFIVHVVGGKVVRWEVKGR